MNNVIEKYKVVDIVLLDREQAVNTISSLIGLIERYGMATVSDFYELLGITSNYTADKWGWKHVSDFKIIEVSGGYSFEYPELEETVKIVDTVDVNLLALADKTGLSSRTVKELLAKDYIFVDEFKKPYRFEKKSL